MQKVTIGQTLIPEFDLEMANTRNVLARVPDNKLDWRIHPKSNTIGWVANHLADLPSWTKFTLGADSVDLAPIGAPPRKTTPPRATKDNLEIFDTNVKEGLELLASVQDEVFAQPWSLKKAGETIFTLPKSVVYRSYVISHTIHHRAHVCVYFRMNEIPVPGLYGPSADEQG